MRRDASSAALALLLAATLALAGCGQKGPLTLPERQTPITAAPSTAAPSSAAPPASAPSDATTAAPASNAPKPADDRDNTKR